MNKLNKLLEAYRSAPEKFQATRYWKGYEDRIIKEIKNADISKLRSGIYPIFGTFGFSESVYHYHPNTPFLKKMAMQLGRNLFIGNKSTLPYSMNINDIREMAFQRCIDVGKLTNARSITEIEVSTFGDPNDLFQIDGKNYTMQFLNFYLRYCFAHKHIKFTGKEVVVELGSGSGHQIEVLKKLYPELTIICFDLPAPLYLCENYLTEALGENAVVSSEETLDVKDLSSLKKGKVSFLGNWHTPLLKNFNFDVFWNAASFGEMEPDVVQNYLSYVLNQAEWIFLLQAKHGKETFGGKGVKTPTTFKDYDNMLKGYKLVEQQDVVQANRRMTQSGGYFEAVWKKAN